MDNVAQIWSEISALVAQFLSAVNKLANFHLSVSRDGDYCSENGRKCFVTRLHWYCLLKRFWCATGYGRYSWIETTAPTFDLIVSKEPPLQRQCIVIRYLMSNNIALFTQQKPWLLVDSHYWKFLFNRIFTFEKRALQGLVTLFLKKVRRLF